MNTDLESRKMPGLNYSGIFWQKSWNRRIAQQESVRPGRGEMSESSLPMRIVSATGIDALENYLLEVKIGAVDLWHKQ